MMWDDDGHGRWAMHDSGAGWVMVLVMLVVVIAVVVAVVAILRGTTGLSTAPHAASGAPGAPSAPGARGPDPRAILQERFARGEIDEPDFRARMRALDESSG